MKKLLSVALVIASAVVSLALFAPPGKGGGGRQGPMSGGTGMGARSTGMGQIHSGGGMSPMGGAGFQRGGMSQQAGGMGGFRGSSLSGPSRLNTQSAGFGNVGMPVTAQRSFAPTPQVSSATAGRSFVATQQGFSPGAGRPAGSLLNQNRMGLGRGQLGQGPFNQGIGQASGLTQPSHLISTTRGAGFNQANLATRATAKQAAAKQLNVGGLGRPNLLGRGLGQAGALNRPGAGLQRMGNAQTRQLGQRHLQQVHNAKQQQHLNSMTQNMHKHPGQWKNWNHAKPYWNFYNFHYPIWWTGFYPWWWNEYPRWRTNYYQIVPLNYDDDVYYDTSPVYQTTVYKQYTQSAPLDDQGLAYWDVSNQTQGVLAVQSDTQQVYNLQSGEQTQVPRANSFNITLESDNGKQGTVTIQAHQLVVTEAPDGTLMVNE